MQPSLQSPIATTLKRSAAAMTPSSNTIVVRVGGTDFRTSRETLDQGGRGYFAARLKHDAVVEMDFGREVLPCIEVDRDPENFRIVLSWMRSHRLPSAVAADRQVLEDLEPEATFYALDDLRQTVVEALRREAAPLRAFSLTTGVVMVMNSGHELMQSVELGPHEYCLVTHVTAKTNLFSRARKHHKLLCRVEEREEGSEVEKDWTTIVKKLEFSSMIRNEEDGVIKAEAYEASHIVIGAFVYKHVGGDDDPMTMEPVVGEELPTDGVCAPQYSQRANLILGPRGVHNAASTSKFAVDPDATGKETRLVFGDKEYEMESGATWTIFGVIGPAAKVLEYARGSSA